MARPPRRAARQRPLRVLPLLLLAALGCDDSGAPPLARIDSVQPGVIEPGDVLVIEGEGFVEGPARLIFDGELRPSGAGPAVRSRTTLEALAISGARIELHVTGTAIARLSPGPATFSGSLEVSFPTALEESAVRVEARLPEIALELRPAGSAVAAVARRTREAEAFLDGLGIGLAAGGDDAGLVVERVRPGSPADRAGLDPRDRLLALDGAALAGVSDIAGPDPRLPHSLSVMSATGVPRELELFPDPAATWPLDEFAALMLAAVALGLFLAFAAPSRRPGRIAAPSAAADPLARALGIGALSVPMLALPALLMGGAPGPAAMLALSALTAAGAAGVALWGNGGLLARAGSLACGLLPLAAALGMGGAFGSSVDPADIVASQGIAPWGWHAWSNPFSLVAAAAATALLWPESGRPGAPPAARIAAWIAACGGAMAIAVCVLGGWLLPGATAEPGPARAPGLITGAAVFAAKCWLVLVAARWLAGAGRVDRRGHAGRRAPARLLSALVLVAALGLALAWDRCGLPREIDTAGRVLASGVFAALSTALVGRGLAGLLARRGAGAGDGEAGGVSGSRLPTSSS